MFKFTDPGLQVEGWKKAQQPSESMQNRRVLRQRKCNPPRLTTKTPNPKVRKR